MNILIVDDESDSLAEIGDYVRKFGRFDCCVCCSNALEALEQAARIPFDVALLDIEMPGMNGLELAERLSSLYSGVAIAFITAYNHFAAEAFEVNAVDYILKPVREDRLFRALHKLTNGMRSHIPADAGENGLSIAMFRKFTVRVRGELLKWNRQKSIELFAYLLENKESPVRKELLCELLWPDLEPQKALMNLQTAIYSIRKTLAASDIGQISIDYAGNHYILRLKDVLTDADRFEALLQMASERQDCTLLEQAVSLYAGDYLEEEGWIWAEPKKASLRNKYVNAVRKRPEK